MTDETPRSLPKVGLDAYSLTGPSGHEICENDIFVMLRTVKDLGAEGLQAHLPDDSGAMRAAFDLAADLDLYVEPYVQLPLQWRGDTAEIERRERKFHLVARLSAERGVHAFHCTMGARERFQDVGRWKEFTTATAASLRRWGPELREHRQRIAIENHWDYTTYEIVEIAEQAGADIAGVGLDTGNLPILGEASGPAIARALPFTVTTHLKDVMLFSTPTGAGRPVMPIGGGQIDIAGAVRDLCRQYPALHFTIEDHPIIYPIDYFESWWLEAVPEVTAHDIAATARLAHEGDRWLAERRVPDPHTAELIPWSIRGPNRLRADVRAVKDMLRAAMSTPGVDETRDNRAPA